MEHLGFCACKQQRKPQADLSNAYEYGVNNYLAIGEDEVYPYVERTIWCNMKSCLIFS